MTDDQSPQHGETALAGAELAYRARVLFEETFMADYRGTFRGGLGRTQAEVLERLYEYGSEQPRQIADAIHVPKQHVSKIVARLVADGLAGVSPSEKDGRSKLVFITEAGRTFIDGHIAEGRELSLERIERLSDEEQEQLVATLSTLVGLLQKM